MNLIADFWRGRRSLAAAFWLVYVLGSLVSFKVLLPFADGLGRASHTGTAWLAIAAVILVYQVFALVSVWRCAGGWAKFGPALARIYVTLYVALVGVGFVVGMAAAPAPVVAPSGAESQRELSDSRPTTPPAPAVEDWRPYGSQTPGVLSEVDFGSISRAGNLGNITWRLTMETPSASGVRVSISRVIFNCDTAKRIRTRMLLFRKPGDRTPAMDMTFTPEQMRTG